MCLMRVSPAGWRWAFPTPLPPGRTTRGAWDILWKTKLPWAGWGSGPTEQCALPIGVLASTNALPAKAEFARLLQSRYSSVSRLNAAWNTSLASWNDISNHAVTLPSPLTAACVADCGALLTEFALRYFSIVRADMKQFAPNQLYL